jgi:uncharacterized protein (DUF58 family)
VIKLGRSFWWLIALVVLSFILTRLPEISDHPIYSRLLIILLLTLVGSFLWSLFSMLGLKLARVTRSHRLQVGEVFTENFTLANRSLFPKVWLKITDQAHLEGVSGSRVITWVGPHQTRSYVAYSLLRERGWFTLGPTMVETGDIFGIFTWQKVFDSHARLLVIPHTVDILTFPAPFGILPGGRALRQKTLEVTPYAAGVREYVSGDPLKRIHWPTSARKQKLIVKEFEKDPLAEVWIFLDSRADVQLTLAEQAPDRVDKFLWIKGKKEFHLPPSTEEYAVAVAASIGQFYINQKREVGLVAAGQRYTILPAERGERQLGKILETLAVLRAEGDMPLWGLVSSQLNHLSRGSTVILITPSADEQLLTVVMALVQRGLMPVVILIDRESFGGEEGTDTIRPKLANRGILVFVIEKGADLKAKLENPNTVLDERLIFRRG